MKYLLPTGRTGNSSLILVRSSGEVKGGGEGQEAISPLK